MVLNILKFILYYEWIFLIELVNNVFYLTNNNNVFNV